MVRCKPCNRISGGFCCCEISQGRKDEASVAGSPQQAELCVDRCWGGNGQLTQVVRRSSWAKRRERYWKWRVIYDKFNRIRSCRKKIHKLHLTWHHFWYQRRRKPGWFENQIWLPASSQLHLERRDCISSHPEAKVRRKSYEVILSRLTREGSASRHYYNASQSLWNLFVNDNQSCVGRLGKSEGVFKNPFGVRAATKNRKWVRWSGHLQTTKNVVASRLNCVHSSV